MNKIIAIITFFAVTLSLTMDAMAQEKTKSKVDPNSIYARLGGQPAIDAAVDIFYKKVMADDRVNHFFEDTNMKRQHRRQKTFLAQALGGPKRYKGKDMRKAHVHLDLKEKDFNIIAEHLQATLKELKVDDKLIGEVLTVVGSVKDDVLNRPKGKKK